MAQNHSTTISLTTERQSLTELVQEYTGELRAVAYLMAECESIGPFREDIASLVKHLSHDIDEVLEGVEG